MFSKVLASTVKHIYLHHALQKKIINSKPTFILELSFKKKLLISHIRLIILFCSLLLFFMIERLIFIKIYRVCISILKFSCGWLCWLYINFESVEKKNNIFIYIHLIVLWNIYHFSCKRNSKIISNFGQWNDNVR